MLFGGEGDDDITANGARAVYPGKGNDTVIFGGDINNIISLDQGKDRITFVGPATIEGTINPRELDEYLISSSATGITSIDQLTKGPNGNLYLKGIEFIRASGFSPSDFKIVP